MLADGGNAGHGSTVHGADTGSLPDARLVAAGNRAADSANGGAADCTGSYVLADRHLIRVALAIGKIGLIPITVNALQIDDGAAGILHCRTRGNKQKAR